jgi:pantetheine-phosphate adenylyltransferase
VTIAVLVNKSKSGLFTLDERMDMVRETTADYGNVVVESFGGLLVDFCRDRGIPVIVKGLRAVSDFDYELQMAQMNHSLDGVETLFLSTNPLYSFLSSSLVKEVATYGGDVSGLVPELVLKRLTQRLGRPAE